MSDVCVRTARNYFLVRGHGNIGGREAIYAQHPKYKNERENDDRITKYARPCWDSRKPVTMVEYRKDNENKERNNDKRDDDLLRRFFFFPWSCVESSLEKRDIVERHIHRKPGGRGRKNC